MVDDKALVWAGWATCQAKANANEARGLFRVGGQNYAVLFPETS